MKFAQICYGKPNNRWESFNVGGAYSSEMIEFFTQCSTNNAGQEVPAEYLRHEKYLWEITASEKFTEVSKVKFGIIDGSGRAAIFSHGYVFNNEDRCLENPKDIISISDSNFKFSYEQTKEIPTQLFKDEDMDFDEAITISGINETTLLNMLFSVYISLNSLSNYPVYFIYNGDLRQIKALAYLIYSFLPYSLRYKISISNTNNLRLSTNKSFMFVNEAPSGEYFYDLITGETNINLEEVRSNRSLYPFIVALKKYSFNGFDDYCQQLDGIREKLGYPYICEYIELLNVDTVLSYLDSKKNGVNSFSKLEDLDLTKFLLEFSSKAPFSNDLVDEFIAELLIEYKDRGLVPNELLMNKIKFRNTKTKLDLYKNIYKQLQMAVLVESGEEATVSFLNDERERDTAAFNEWVEYIINSGGSKYIDKFFGLKIDTAKDLNSVLVFWKEVKSFNNNTVLAYTVKKKMQELALRNMVEAPNTSSAFHNVFLEYSKVYIDAFGKEPVELISELVKLYWPQYNIDSFEFSQSYFTNIYELAEYNMPLEVQVLCDLYEKVMLASTKDDNSSRDGIVSNLKLFNKINLGQKLRNKICEFIVREFEYQQHSHIVFWYEIAKFNAGQRALPKVTYYLVEWNIDVFMSDTYFSNALYDDDVTRDFIDEFIMSIEGERNLEGYIDIVPAKSEEYYLAKDRLNQLKKYLKALNKEEKSRAKNKVKKHLEEDEYEDVFSDDSDGSDDSDEGDKKKFRWFKR